MSRRRNPFASWRPKSERPTRAARTATIPPDPDTDALILLAVDGNTPAEPRQRELQALVRRAIERESDPGYQAWLIAAAEGADVADIQKMAAAEDRHLPTRLVPKLIPNIRARMLYSMRDIKERDEQKRNAALRHYFQAVWGIRSQPAPVPPLLTGEVPDGARRV